MATCRCRSAASSPNRPSRRTTANARWFNSTMPLILHGLPPLHWALAGIGIAGVTLALLLLASRRLGISPGFEDIGGLALPVPYFKREAVISGRRWRLPLLVGLVLG